MSQYDWSQPFGYETAAEQRHRADDFYYGNNSSQNNQSYQRRSSSNGPSFGLIGVLIGLAFKIIFWVFRLVFGIKKKR